MCQVGKERFNVQKQGKGAVSQRLSEKRDGS